MSNFQNIYTKFIEPRKQVLLFLICGGIAAGANIVSRYLFFFFFNYTLSIVLAFCIGLTTAFILFKFTVFQSKGKKTLGKEVSTFLFVNAFGLLQTLIISKILAEFFFPCIDFTFYPYDIAHIIGVITPVIVSYFLHKYFTFARK